MLEFLCLEPTHQTKSKQRLLLAWLFSKELKNLPTYIELELPLKSFNRAYYNFKKQDVHGYIGFWAVTEYSSSDAPNSFSLLLSILYIPQTKLKSAKTYKVQCHSVPIS